MHREDHTAARRDLGRHLRELRERKGLSLDALAEETRIRRDYLESLEAGDYDAFPGEYWARQFLRSYATALGINAGIATSQAFADGADKNAQGRSVRSPSQHPEPSGARAQEDRDGRELAEGSPTAREVARTRLRADGMIAPRPTPSRAPSGDGLQPDGAPVRPYVVRGPSAGSRGTGRRLASAALPEAVAPARSRRAARRASRGGGWINGGLTLAAAVVVALVAIAVWPRPAKAPTRATLAPVGNGATTPGAKGKTTSGTGPASHPADQGKTTHPTTVTKPKTGTGKGATPPTTHPKTTRPSVPAVKSGTLVATGPTTYAVGASSIQATLHVGFLSWVRVNADGKQALWKEEPGNFTTTFTARHQLAVYLGYPAGSTITVNGHTVGPLQTKSPEWVTFDTRPARTGG